MMDMTKESIDFTLQKQREDVPVANLALHNENEPAIVEAILNKDTETDTIHMSEQVHHHCSDTSPVNNTTPSPSLSPLHLHTGNINQNRLKTNEDVISKPSDYNNIIKKTAESPLNAASDIDIRVNNIFTPPPRPLTSYDHGFRIDASAALPKSRSLPTSPNHMRVNITADSVMSPHIASALFNINSSSRKLLNNDTAAAAAKKRVKSKIKQTNSGATQTAPSTVANQQFCLRWNNYQANLTNVFDELLQSESFVDVTLACEGHSIKAHKMVLSACSPYFQALFYDNPCQHPIIIMRDVRWKELKGIMEFMYKGQINVSQDQINPLLKVAEMLKIRGLAEVNAGSHDEIATHPSMMPVEQHMTVFGDDDDDDNEDIFIENPLSAVTISTPEEVVDDEDEEKGHLGLKRARILNSAMLNLAVAHRKRSHDGNFMNKPIRRNCERRTERRYRSITPTPTDEQKQDTNINSVEDNSNTEMNAATSQLAMMASTIVRNPFASPKTMGFAITPNSISENSVVPTNNSTTTKPTTPIDYRPTIHNYSPTSSTQKTVSDISASNTQISPRSLCNDNNAVAAAAVAAAAVHQLSTAHSHSAAAAAAAVALANSNHSHHGGHHLNTISNATSQNQATAAQKYAATQQQLHAAAHSRVAIASALGASLVAAANVKPSGVIDTSTTSNTNNVNTVETNNNSVPVHHDDMEIKPEIAEMIREEERAKLIEGGHVWMGGASSTSVAESYQYQLQSMWQKCWNTNQQNLVQQLRFRERGPLKSWRPEAMAEAIFSVLKEGLSLSQAARKYDIPYPTFVLYANRVHNMLGPSLDGGTDPRPKARGRPQRILLGMWPEELIRSVIKAVVFRDYREIKEDMGITYSPNGQQHSQSPYVSVGNGSITSNGYHSSTKLVGHNSSLTSSSDLPNSLSTMAETLRLQPISQPQQLHNTQKINVFKSSAYLQRSEVEDHVLSNTISDAKQRSDRRCNDNLSDMCALSDIMGMQGLNAMHNQLQHGNESSSSGIMDANVGGYTRERDLERELKEAIQVRQYSNLPRISGTSNAMQKQSFNPCNLPYMNYKTSSQLSKDQTDITYNKRFLENLPPGINIESIATNILQKSVHKSPRFEDFFNSGSDINELFPNAELTASAATAAGNSSYPPAHESLMKIKLEHQAPEIPHEDS